MRYWLLDDRRKHVLTLKVPFDIRVFGPRWPIRWANGTRSSLISLARQSTTSLLGRRVPDAYQKVLTFFCRHSSMTHSVCTRIQPRCSWLMTSSRRTKKNPTPERNREASNSTTVQSVIGTAAAALCWRFGVHNDATKTCKGGYSPTGANKVQPNTMSSRVKVLSLVANIL